MKNQMVLLAGLATLGWSGLASQESGAQTPDAPFPTLHPVASTPWTAQPGARTGRIVVLEYTSGSSCEGCHFNEEAINALLRRYPASAFVVLGYHLDYDWNLTDPADSGVVRFLHWYGLHNCLPAANHRPMSSPIAGGCNQPGQIAGEPDTLVSDGLVDGRSVLPILARQIPDSLSEFFYARYVAAIDTELRRAPEAFFRVETAVQDGKVNVRVHVDSLKGKHPQVYLRVLLVADTVRLHPANPYFSPVLQDLLREQHGVVYGIAHTPTLAMGLPLTGPGTIQHTFDVTAIQHRISRVRAGDTTLTPGYDLPSIHKSLFFSNDQDWRLQWDHLRVVAFVQDAHSGHVLQTVVVPVATAHAVGTKDTVVAWTELRPPGGGFMEQMAHQQDLPQLLQNEIAKARMQGRTPFLEIGATWCAGCIALEKDIENRVPALVDAFAGAYLIHLDYDDWNLGDLLQGTNIPALVALNPQGKAAGQLIGNVEAPVIKQFVHGHLWRDRVTR